MSDSTALVWFRRDLRAHDHAALARAQAEAYDLLVLDLMLPQVSGLDICQQVRADARAASTPIIMVTARAEESERIDMRKVLGLEQRLSELAEAISARYFLHGSHHVHAENSPSDLL